MKLTINFVKGTKINGGDVYKAESWHDYDSEQIKLFLDGLAEGYKIRFNHLAQDPLVFESAQVESVTVQL